MAPNFGYIDGSPSFATYRGRRSWWRESSLDVGMNPRRWFMGLRLGDRTVVPQRQS